MSAERPAVKPNLPYARIAVSADATPEQRSVDGRYVLLSDVYAALRFFLLDRRGQDVMHKATVGFVAWTDPGVIVFLLMMEWITREEGQMPTVTFAGRKALKEAP